MWWPKAGTGRIVLIAGAVLALAACGFRPLYADGGQDTAASAELARIEVAVIPDRSGQILRADLIDGLSPRGRPARPLYRLEVTLRERQEELGIDKTDTAVRANLFITANFSLLPADGGEPLLDRRVGLITSYNILLDEFATLTAENDARERALRQIGSDIRTQLALYFSRAG
ncbi:MAG: hypothetical protein HKM95_16520 [Inquilinus sp.]|nr:hypothetical protein [Inquilinus sp.]